MGTRLSNFILLFCFFISTYVFAQSLKYRESFVLWDTFIKVGASFKPAFDVESFLKKWENEFSPEKFKALAATKEILLSTSEARVFKEAGGFVDLTNGYFDPTVGVLSQLWGFWSGNYRVPSAHEIKKALSFVGWRKLVKIERVSSGLWKVVKKRGVIFDFGGIAKGAGIDMLVDKLKEDMRSYDVFFVDAGGDVVICGKKLWRVGIKNPRGKGIAGVLEFDLSEKECVAIATSGDYERYFEKDGKRYCHIFDPRTGYPVIGPESVTVIAKNLTKADALATAFFAMASWEVVKRVADKLKVGVVWIGSDGKMIENNFAKPYLKGVKFYTSKDWILIVILAVFLSVVLFLSWKAGKFGGVGKMKPSRAVILTPYGKKVFELPREGKVVIKGKLGDVKLKFDGYRVRVISSSCPDKICMKHGWLEDVFPRDSIICVPNEVEIRLEGVGKDINDVDLVVR